MHTLSLIGFGSQASTWASCLRDSGWSVRIYLHRRQESFQKATSLGFKTFLIDDLPEHLTTSHHTPQWLALLCPDSSIGPLYDALLAPLDQDLRLILAHGFALYSQALQLKNPRHLACLLAPKAIGPKILEQFRAHFPEPHPLRAAACNIALHATLDTHREKRHFLDLARGLGFAPEALIPANFEEETVGDLISEQGLLCGGIFNLLAWTLEAMEEAGIPKDLIREECIGELELIASLLRSEGPASTFQKISEIAQCGTIAMHEKLEQSSFKKEFASQMQSVRNGEFLQYYQSKQWHEKAQAFKNLLEHWETKLMPNNGKRKHKHSKIY